MASCTSLNPFVSNAPFLFPLKTSENRFGGYRKGALGTNGLSEFKDTLKAIGYSKSKQKSV